MKGVRGAKVQEFRLPLPPLSSEVWILKGVALRNCVSVDSGRLEVVCFLCGYGNLVSADSKEVKVVCFDTDSQVRGSADSKRLSEDLTACRMRLARMVSEYHD
jgi:hypothetical protein